MQSLRRTKQHNEEHSVAEVLPLHVMTSSSQVPAYIVDAVKAIPLCSFVESAWDLCSPCAVSLQASGKGPSTFILLEPA